MVSLRVCAPWSSFRSRPIFRSLGRLRGSMICGLTVASLITVVLPVPSAVAIAQQDAITYVYDDLGRLEAVVDPGQTNGIARYTYDSAGNLLSIARQSSTVTTVLDFQPKTTTRSSSVTVYGAGFSPTAGQNTVRFGGPSGTAATVVSATKTQLQVTVPASGSVNGTVFVSSPGGSATSSQQFALDTSTPPAITGISAAVATMGSTVTVTGSGFDPSAPAMNNVFLNGIRAQVTAATATTLTTVVPPFLTSGHVSVQTRWGQATSMSDLFVPPAIDGVPSAVTDVESTGRTTLGTPTAVSVTTPQKVAVRSFDGTQGGRVFMEFSSPSGNQAWLSLVDPFGRVMGKDLMTTGFLEPRTLPVSGTYEVVVDPIDTQTGNFTFTAFDVPADLSGTITPDGGPVVANITAKGQNAGYTFTGTANQRVSLRFNGSGWTGLYWVRILRPEGIELTSTLSVFGWQDPVTLPVSGIYTVVIDPIAGATGSTTLTAYDVPPDSSGPIQPNGPPVNVTVTADNAGQNANLTFDSTVNQQATINVTGSTFPQAYAHLYLGTPPTNPISLNHLFLGGNTTIGPISLSAAGSYTLVIDPIGGFTGSANIALTLAAGRATPRGGRGDRLRTDRPPSPHSPRAATALAGVVLGLDGSPLAGVSVGSGDVAGATDSNGRFRLAGLHAGPGVLVVDGASASTEGASYGLFQIQVELERGRTTELGSPVWMPELDTRHVRRIASPTRRDVVLRTPLVPGLRIQIPKGSLVRDLDGRAVHELSITPVPIDRPPFPMPDAPDFPIYFTVQPGGAAVLPEGARIIYPNSAALPAGTEVRYMDYEPAEDGWEFYGRGRVSPDGMRIVPDPDTRVRAFTGSAYPIPLYLSPPLADTNPLSELGEPVDLSTGLFHYTKTDLALPGPMPIQLTRIYRQGDPNAEPFGLGMTYSYQSYLSWDWPSPDNQWKDLILPGGVRVHFDRITPGTDVEHAVYEATATPGPFFKSRISWDPVLRSWLLTRRDGTVMVFGLGGSGSALRDVADRYGNRLVLIGPAGTSPQPATQIVSWPSGRWINLSISNGRVTQATDDLGRSVGYGYDGQGRLASVTDPNQFGQPSPKSSIYGWVTDPDCTSPGSVLATITDPRNITWLSNTYGPGCRVTQQTVPTATGTDVYTFAYTPSGPGAVTQADMTDPNGNVHRESFDSTGYMTSETIALGTPSARTFTYERDPTNHRTSAVVDAFHNRRTEFTYNAFGQPTSVTRLAGTPQAVTTSYTYDPVFRQLETITDPLTHVTRFAYDAAGCLDSVQDPMSRTTLFDCNGAGQITQITDPLTHASVLSYAHGDLTSATDPLGRTTSRFTDGGGRVLAVTDPLNHPTTYAFDKLNELTQVTDPIGGLISFTLDEDGNLTEVNDQRRGSPSRTDLVYNNLNLPSTRTDPLGRQETFTYDDLGNLTFWTDRKNQTTEFRYDALNQLTFAGYKRTAGPVYESTITYTWDVGSRLTQIADTTANAGTITRTYDDLDRLTNETSVNASASGVTYTYNPDDTRATMTVQNQTQVLYGYNPAAQLTSLTQGGLVVGLDYLGDGRLRQVSLPSSPVLTQTYAYDAAGEIASIAYQRGTGTPDDLSYGYDPSGARTSVFGSYARTGLPAATTATAVYNVANQLTSWSGAAVASDLNGNMTSQAGLTYAYNARNQLTSVKQSKTTLGAFVYDGLGRRVRRTISSAVTRPVYDGWNVVQERSSAGSVTANLLVGRGLDDVFTRTETAQREFLSDALGSTVALADTSGVVQTSYTYEPFGRTTATGASSSSTYQFTGRENDSTGTLSLYNLRARYLSPTLARFISQDPIGLSSSDVNLYEYADDTPTGRIDPTGLFSVWPPVVGPDLSVHEVGGGNPAGWVWDSTVGTISHLDDWWSMARKDFERQSEFVRREGGWMADDLFGEHGILTSFGQCLVVGLDYMILATNAGLDPEDAALFGLVGCAVGMNTPPTPPIT